MNYVGVDYHKRYSVATVMNEAGETLAQRRLDNRLTAFRSFLEPFGEFKATVEATRNWSVPVEILEDLTDQVVLAHPYLTKAIAKHKFHSDKIDSRILTEMLRVNWLPSAYLRNRVNRDQQLILRVRCYFVRLRTSIKNRIHDLVDRQAEPIRETAQTFSDLFGKKGLAWIRGLALDYPYQALLAKLLAAYDVLTEQIKGSDDLVKELYQADPSCQLLASIPGFGKFFAVLVNVEIGDIKRFPNSGRLCSYAGVVPWNESSGGKVWHGSLTKQSNQWLRWAFIEAAIPAIVGDEGLKSYYDYYRWRKDVKTAKVVIGRRLCCIAYRVLAQQRPYYDQKPRVKTSREDRAKQ